MALVVLSPIRKARPRARGGKPAQARLDMLNRQFTKVVSADLAAGFTSFGKRVDYTHLANAVYSGNWKNVYATLPTQLLPSEVEASLKRLGISIEEASKVAASGIPVGSGLSVDDLLLPRNSPAVDEYLDVKSGALITNIEDNMQVNVQQALRAGLDNKETAEQIAARIETTGIGLNYRQNQAMVNFEQARRAEGLDGQALADRLEEQASRYLKQRCDMIAQTEVSNAQNFAQLQVWNTAREQGAIYDTACKQWVVDGDPCDICKELDGQIVPLDALFVTSEGDAIESAPVHPHCRCSLALINSNSHDDVNAEYKDNDD